VDMPTQFPHTFFHPDQPQPAPAFLLRIETHAVVLDGDGNEADAAVKAEANLAGCRVPGAIRQRFLDNPVDAGPMGIRENVGIPITIANARINVIGGRVTKVPRVLVLFLLER
jgi:hypothetical protein